MQRAASAQTLKGKMAPEEYSVSAPTKNPGVLMVAQSRQSSGHVVLGERRKTSRSLAQDSGAVHIGLGTEAQGKKDIRSSGKITGFTSIDLPVS